MAENKAVKVVSWIVVVWAILGALGMYRYFLIPIELRFEAWEALWLAASFLGDLLLAVALLLLIRRPHYPSHDE